MGNLLVRIQDTVMKYADIVSQIADVDVEVVDDRLFRVAGTGMFREKIIRICPKKDMCTDTFCKRERHR